MFFVCVWSSELDLSKESFAESKITCSPGISVELDQPGVSQDGLFEMEPGNREKMELKNAE
jgi:hypothetical protein